MACYHTHAAIKNGGVTVNFEWASVFSLLLFCFSTSATPGPNTLTIAASGLKFGIKRSLPHYFGICLGFPTMVFVLGFGFGAVFIQYRWLQLALKIVGSLYFIYLAWKISQSHRLKKTKGSDKPFTFVQALLFQWLNAKAWFMAISAVSIFALPGLTHLQMAILISVIYFLTCFVSTSAWLFFGKAMQRYLKNEHHLKIFNYSLAVCLLLSLVLIFVE